MEKDTSCKWQPKSIGGAIPKNIGGAIRLSDKKLALCLKLSLKTQKVLYNNIRVNSRGRCSNSQHMWVQHWNS